jgi:hypothetical protein
LSREDPLESNQTTTGGHAADLVDLSTAPPPTLRSRREAP